MLFFSPEVTNVSTQFYERLTYTELKLKSGSYIDVAIIWLAETVKILIILNWVKQMILLESLQSIAFSRRNHVEVYQMSNKICQCLCELYINEKTNYSFHFQS